MNPFAPPSAPIGEDGLGLRPQASTVEVVFLLEMGLAAIVFGHGIFDLVVFGSRLSFAALVILSVLGFATPALGLRLFGLWPFQVIPAVAIIVHVEQLGRRFF